MEDIPQNSYVFKSALTRDIVPNRSHPSNSAPRLPSLGIDRKEDGYIHAQPDSILEK